jgi:hypothetical protein
MSLRLPSGRARPAAAAGRLPGLAANGPGAPPDPGTIRRSRSAGRGHAGPDVTVLAAGVGHGSGDPGH